jgi:hypothetical protein
MRDVIRLHRERYEPRTEALLGCCERGDHKPRQRLVSEAGSPFLSPKGAKAGASIIETQAVSSFSVGARVES